MPTYAFQDVDDGVGQGTRLTLPDEYELEARTTRGGNWTAKLWIFRRTRYEDSARLRGRPGASILITDCEATRQSIGTKIRAAAIELAAKRLADRHARRHGQRRSQTLELPRAGGALSFAQVSSILSDGKLLRASQISPREQDRILKAFAAVDAVLGSDVDVRRLSQHHIDLVYARTTGCKPSGAELTDKELERMGLRPRDLGATLNGRPRRSRFRLRTRPGISGLVSPSTTHNDLTAVGAMLTRMVGAQEKDEAGNVYLVQNPMHYLILGSGAGVETLQVSRERAYYIIRYADAATSVWNEGRRSNASFMRRNSVSADGTLRQVPLGAVRCLYCVGWYNGPRHEQILGLRMEDNLTTRQAVRDAIRASRRAPGQESAKVEWAEIWSRHGALFLAAEFAQKPGYDRVCPTGPELRREIDRFVQLRCDQGLPATGPLFRYLGHPRALDGAVVREIIRIAEDLATEECVADGHDPEEVFCVDVRPVHDLRTSATNRWAHMGWDHNRNAAWLGCLSTNISVGNAADAEYRKLNPHLVLALAEGMTLNEALTLTGVADDAQKHARMEVPF